MGWRETSTTIPLNQTRPNPISRVRISDSFLEEVSMMNSKVWCCGILSAVSELSDIEYQRKVWLGEDKDRVSSFIEVVNRMYDDYDVDGFLRTVGPSLRNPSEVTSALKTLETALDSIDNNASDSTIIALPEWPLICALAERAKHLLTAESDVLSDVTPT
jgi:hypothetical protein